MKHLLSDQITIPEDNLACQPITNVRQAYNRIKDHLVLTPVISSEALNQYLGHEIFFKLDNLQHTGAFKVRGVLNHLLALHEVGAMPTKVVGYSTGNHGLGLAWAAKKLALNARVYLPKNVTLAKQHRISLYNADVIISSSRNEAELRTAEDGYLGFHYMHPSDSDTTIAGAGTSCYEALQQVNNIDAIFASCGGGGLLAGCYLAKELLSPSSLLFGAEPEAASDAFLSLQRNAILRFKDSPVTIADGLRTLSISQRTFNYLKKLNGILLATETRIAYWSFWLSYLLNSTCETSSTVAMEAACQWLKQQKKPCRVLIMISGGNVDLDFYNNHLSTKFLSLSPKL